jgi:hypothetical protein
MSDKDDLFAGLPEHLQLELGRISSYDYGPRRITLGERLERLENIAVLLAQEASRGQGSTGKPFWDFIDAIRAERVSQT